MNRTSPGVFLVLIAALLAAAAVPAWSAPRELRISHQFAEGDARHDLAAAFAKAVEEKTQGELTFKIFPSQALFKSAAQYDAMAKGALDLSVFPLAYASGKVPELDITLMPCIISSVEEGMSWLRQTTVTEAVIKGNQAVDGRV